MSSGASTPPSNQAAVYRRQNKSRLCGGRLADAARVVACSFYAGDGALAVAGAGISPAEPARAT
jgi:hypothetical protein